MEIFVGESKSVRTLVDIKNETIFWDLLTSITILFDLSNE